MIQKVDEKVHIINRNGFVSLKEMRRLLADLRGSFPSKEEEARIPKEVYSQEKMKNAAIYVDPKKEIDPTMIALLGQFPDTSNVSPKLIVGNSPKGLWQNLHGSSFYKKLYPSMTLETVYEDKFTAEYTIETSGQRHDRETKDVKKQIIYGLLNFNGKPVWVVSNVTNKKDLDAIDARREKLGFPRIFRTTEGEKLMDLDIIYSPFPQEEIEETHEALSILATGRIPVFKPASPVEEVGKKEDIPVYGVDVNKKAWRRDEANSPTKALVSSLARIPGIILKVVAEELNVDPGPENGEPKFWDHLSDTSKEIWTAWLIQKGENDENGKIPLSSVSIGASTQIIENKNHPFLNKPPSATTPKNLVPFTEEEYDGLKSQINAILRGSGIEISHYSGLDEAELADEVRLRPAFNGLANGTIEEIFFNLAPEDFEPAVATAFRKRKSREPSDSELAQETKAFIEELLEGIFRTNEITSNIIQIEQVPVDTKNVSQSRKIFRGPGDVRVDFVEHEDVPAQPFVDALEKAAELKWSGRGKNEQKRLRRFRKDVRDLSPKSIKRRRYRVKIKLAFDRYWQDARQLIRASEEYNALEEDRSPGEEMIPKDLTVSRVEDRMRLSILRDTVPPFAPETREPVLDMTVEPQPVFVQALGRMGKVLEHEFLDQLVKLEREFNSGFANLRMVGIFTTPEWAEILPALIKDSTYGPLGVDVTFKNEDNQEGIWGSITINGSQPIYLIKNKTGDPKKGTARFLLPNQYEESIKRVANLTKLSDWQRDNINVFANSGQNYDNSSKSVMRFRRAGAAWVTVSAPWEKREKHPSTVGHKVATMIHNLTDVESLFEKNNGFSPASCTTNCAVFLAVMNKVMFSQDKDFEEFLLRVKPSIREPLRRIRKAFKEKLTKYLKENGFFPKREKLQAELIRVMAAGKEGEEDQDWLGHYFPRESKELRDKLKEWRERARADHFSHMVFKDGKLQTADLTAHIDIMRDPEFPKVATNHLTSMYADDALVGAFIDGMRTETYTDERRTGFQEFLDGSVDDLVQYYEQNITSTLGMQGFANTVHAWTNGQVGAARDRNAPGTKDDGRSSAADQILITSSGVAVALDEVVGLLGGEFVDTISTRVPTETGSEVTMDMAFMMDHLWKLSPRARDYKDDEEESEALEAYKEEMGGFAEVLEGAINDAYRTAEKEAFGGSMRVVEKEHRFTSEMVRRKRGASYFDAGQTKVLIHTGSGKPVFVLRNVSWYDNEWAYVAQVLGLLDSLARFVDKKRGDFHHGNPFVPNNGSNGAEAHRRGTPALDPRSQAAISSAI